MIKVKRPFGYYDTALGIIGRTGENDTRTIDFDCTAALEEYSNANIICVCLRPGDDEPYTIPLSTDGDHRILTLASADLEKEGRMTLELRMVDGDKVLKSARFTGTIASSLQGEGDAPGTPVRDTLDRLDAEIKAAQAVVDDIRAKLDAGDFNGPQGPKGDPGSDASVTAENIQSALGYAPVKDVQVAGSSVLEGGVANVPVASDTVAGVVKTNSWEGTRMDSYGRVLVFPSTNNHVNTRVSNTVLTPTNMDYAVKAAMCDGKGAAWTAAEQKAARERMGVDKAYELIEEVTLEEDVARILRTTEPNGTLYKFKAVVIFVKTSASVASSWVDNYIGSDAGENSNDKIYFGFTTTSKDNFSTAFMFDVYGGFLRGFGQVGGTSVTLRNSTFAISKNPVANYITSLDFRSYKANTVIQIYAIRA